MATLIPLGIVAFVPVGDYLPVGMVVAVLVLPALLLLGTLAVVVPGLASTVRRLHDTNRGGRYAALALIPYAGSMILLALCVLPPDPKGARFDHVPARSHGGGRDEDRDSEV